MITLADVKYRLRIDNEFNDAQIEALMSTAVAALKPSIGYDSASSTTDSKFDTLLDTYVVEYVRALYFQIDNGRVLDALQMQMQALITEAPCD